MDKKLKLVNKHTINANGVQLTFCIEGATAITRFVTHHVADAFTLLESYPAATILES